MEEMNLRKSFEEACKRMPGGIQLSAPLENSKYDVRKSIAKGLLGHDVDESSARMPFFKEAYLRYQAEAQGINTTGFDMQKALSTTLSTYSAGTLPVLIPVYVDPEIVDLTRRATPLVELIPRVTNYGRTAEYNQITVISTAQFLPEDAALNEQNDTYVRQNVQVKFMYSVGRVTGPMFAESKQFLASGGYVDALSLDVKNKTLALKRLEEAAILLGDSVSDWTEPVNSSTMTAAYSYDGLYQLIGNANANGHGGSASYLTDLSASANTPISITSLRKGIRDPRTRGGEPNLIVTDYRTYDSIKALVQDQLRYISQSSIAWGIVTLSFEGVPIIASRFLSTTAANASGKVPSNASSLFVLDTNVIEMRVLQDVSYQELAQVNDSIKFVLKCYEALVVKAPQFNQILLGIA